jgi:nucleoside-diphosphate-sugar epimerase
VTRRLLITGASGFIGLHVAALARQDEGDVLAVSRRDGDLLDPAAAERLIASTKPTHLIHLAWFVEPGAYWTSPENHRWVEASAGLFRSFARHGGERLIGVGTSAEYDWSVNGMMHETTTPLRPATLYGESKKRLHELAQEIGVPQAWGRIFMVYGPGEPETRFIPRMIRALADNEPAVCTAADAARDFIHVRDVAAALLALAKSDVTGAVNIGTGVATKLGEVVHLLVELLGHGENIRELPGNEPPLVVADITRLREEVGFQPSIDLRRGLELTIEGLGD